MKPSERIKARIRDLCPPGITNPGEQALIGVKAIVDYLDEQHEKHSKSPTEFTVRLAGKVEEEPDELGPIPESLRRLFPGDVLLQSEYSPERDAYVISANGKTIGAVGRREAERLGWESAVRRRFECVHPDCRRVVQDSFARRCISIRVSDSRTDVFSVCDEHGDRYTELSDEKIATLLASARAKGLL